MEQDAIAAGPRIGVLADDLTGALASAARLRENALETVVWWRDGERVGTRPDAVVVDMRTRDRVCSPHENARRWASVLAELGCRRYEQRLDSTLRGDAAEELAGLLAGSGNEDACVLAVPAFPQAGRVTIDGQQRVAGGTSIDVARLLFGDRARARVIPLDTVQAGAQAVADELSSAANAGVDRFVADASEERHLRTLAAAAALVESSGLTLVTASPGAWLRYHPKRALPEQGFVLVVISSVSDANRGGLANLGGTGACVLAAEPIARGGEVEEAAARAGAVVVETHTAAPRDDPATLAHDAAAAAVAVLRHLERAGRRCIGLVVSGGHTAGCVVDALEGHGVRADAELLPLCPRGTIVGGPWDGLPLVTKGGLIGDAETLPGLVRALQVETP